MTRTKELLVYEQVVRDVIGKRLKKARQKQKLTQAKLAGMITTTTQASLSNYESGKRTMPVHVLLDLCRALEMSPSKMLSGL